MTQPTGMLEQAQFEKLIEQQGGTLPTYKIVAIEFDPDQNLPADPGIRVMLLNVLTPTLYRDKEGVGFVVLPSTQEMTYEGLAAAHTNKHAWCYRFTEMHYASDWDMGRARYYFKDFEQPFVLEDTTTH